MNKIIFILWYLLLANTTFAFNRQDSLRGSNGRHRAWWDVQRYNLTLNLDVHHQSIKGEVLIAFVVTHSATDSMQIDLQEPLRITEIHNSRGPLSFAREGNVYWVKGNFSTLRNGDDDYIVISYEGTPRKAKNAPWDGGFIWSTDKNGKPWIAVACQGLGASSWWPCKDYQGDEPDEHLQLLINNIPNHLTAVSNGQVEIFDGSPQQAQTFKDSVLAHKTMVANVTQPINSYNVTFYIGDYVHWNDTLNGAKGTLPLSYYALREDSAQAAQQYKEVKPMLRCFEYWLGPYPFYEDGYKIVQAPYLGMEHQSAIAYGNKFLKGYLGTDRSGTGVGMGWDYIIIHESGHEWFGNNITAQDPADNWLHEGFTSYTEALYSECKGSKQEGYKYAKGLYKNIDNDRPVIGRYGVNDEGSNDKYDKGQAVVHMVRMMMNDDEKFRMMLHKMNDSFYHKQITSAQMEQFIISFTGLPLQKFFDQYLRTTQIPKLENKKEKGVRYYKLSNCLDGFSLTVRHLDRTWTVTEKWTALDPQAMAMLNQFLLQ